MITVFLDESGDLGFDLDKRRSSRYFIVTALMCEDTKPVDKAVKKIFTGFSKTEVKNHHGALHATHEKDETRHKLLKNLSLCDVHVFGLVLDKRRVQTRTTANLPVAYTILVNELMNRLLLSVVTDPTVDELHLVASQREKKSLLNQQFTRTVEDHLRHDCGVTATVQITPADQSRGLQAVDMASWSLFQKLEHNNPTYSELLANRLVEVRDVLA